jgi:hypothetical protein
VLDRGELVLAAEAGAAVDPEVLEAAYLGV